MLGTAVLGSAGSGPPRSIVNLPGEGYGRGPYGVGPYGGKRPKAFGSGFGEAFGIGEDSESEEQSEESLPSKRKSSETGAAVGDVIHAEATATAHVIRAVWNQSGVNLEVLNRVEAQLIQLRILALQIEAARVRMGHSHNNPPELVDAPIIDIAALDVGISAISVLRVQLAEDKPEPNLLVLLTNALVAASKAVGKFAAWVAERGATKAGQYLDNIFDGATKKFGESIGTPKGAAGWAAIAAGVINGPENDIKILLNVIKAVGAAIGHG